MDDARLKAVIEAAFEDRAAVSPATGGETRDAVEAALDGLDAGRFRVAAKEGGTWVVHEWLKKAVLLSFRLNDMVPIEGGPGGGTWWDKVPSKFRDGPPRTSARPAFGQCPTASSAARPTSPPASC
jgi:2,3,4,5-tetrahydropyridine-2,6-dicarboxylate N-succinyltransferase